PQGVAPSPRALPWGVDNRQAALLQESRLLYSPRGELTQARSASDGTVPSLALRACVRRSRGAYNPRPGGVSCLRASKVVAVSSGRTCWEPPHSASLVAPAPF